MAVCGKCIHKNVCGFCKEMGFEDVVRANDFNCKDYLPTADVVEVKHGYFKRNEQNIPKMKEFHESECGAKSEVGKYEVKDVVCDYGVYENGELKLILNSKRIAEQIVSLLEEDERLHRQLNQTKDYPPYLDRPKKPNCKTNKPCDHCFNWFECCNHYTKPEQCHRFNKKNKRPTRTKERGGEK